MIYKLQRLYADNKDKPDGEKKRTDSRYVQYNSAEEAERGAKEWKLAMDKKLAGNTSFVDENGQRYTRERIDNEFKTQMNNANELRKDEKQKARTEKINNVKAKYNKAKGKVVGWAKRNKKGLIIGGSVLAAGTGAAIVGSKIHKKNKQDKIKEDVRGYSDVED